MIRTETKNMVIGIDISLGETTCAVVDIRGNIIAMSKFNTCEYSDVNKYASVLCNEIMKLIDGSCGIEYSFGGNIGSKRQFAYRMYRELA